MDWAAAAAAAVEWEARGARVWAVAETARAAGVRGVVAGGAVEAQLGDSSGTGSRQRRSQA